MKQIAIDGLAGSGKGTVAKIIADKCNLYYVDTGVTYRCVALTMLRNKINITDEDNIIKIANELKIEFTSDNKTLLNKEDVSDEIRKKEVNELVYKVSKIQKLRQIMVKKLQEIAENKDIIMEGRDITTVVLPNANYKFYLDASLDTRAYRRFIQNKEKGIDMTLEEIKENIKVRDYNDSHGPLKRTEEQIYIDTTNMTIDEVVNKIINIIGE